MRTKSQERAARDVKVIAAYREKKSAYVVERELGVSLTTIYRILAVNKIKCIGTTERRRFNNVTSKRIARSYESGASFAELVERYGGTEYSIKEAIKRAGVGLKPVAPLERPGEADLIFKLHDQGLSQFQISIKVNRSQSFVSRLLRRSGRKPHHRKGPAHGMWKGGRMIDSSGYVRVLLAQDDPLYAAMTHHNSYVLEHRLVMARKLGRPLLRTETVHHIDGDRTNNSPENLELRQGRHGKHIAMCCMDCGSRRIGHAPLG